MEKRWKSSSRPDGWRKGKRWQIIKRLRKNKEDGKTIENEIHRISNSNWEKSPFSPQFILRVRIVALMLWSQS